MDQQDSIDARNRLGAGRIIAKNLQPYFSRGLDSIELIEKPGTGRITVDKYWRLYYDPAYCLSLTARELSSEWLHNINHLFRGHPERFDNLDGVDKSRADFNFAADAIINSELRDEGVTMPNPQKKAYLEQGQDMGWKPGMPVEQLYWLTLKAKSSQMDSEGLEKNEGTTPQENDESPSDGSTEPPSEVDDDDRAPSQDPSEDQGSKESSKGEKDDQKDDSQKSSEKEGSDSDSSNKDENPEGENSPDKNDKSENSESSDSDSSQDDKESSGEQGENSDSEGDKSEDSDSDGDDSKDSEGDSSNQSESSEGGEKSESDSSSEKSDSSDNNPQSDESSSKSGENDGSADSNSQDGQQSPTEQGDSSEDGDSSSNDSPNDSSASSDRDDSESKQGEKEGHESTDPSESYTEREYINADDDENDSAHGNESDEHDCGSGAGGAPREWEDDPDEKAMDLTNAEILKTDIAKDMLNHERSNPGSIPGGLIRDAKVVLEPEYDWIQEFMNLIRKEIGASYEKIDHTYSRMSKKQSSQNTIILPGWQSPDPFEVAAIIDTSGSMGEKTDIALALGLLEDLLKTFGQDSQRQGIHLISCDAGATASFAKNLESVQLHGGGGTDMRIGIKTASQIKPMVDVILTITDGGTPWPKEIPSDNRQAKYIAIIVGGGATKNIPHWMHVIELKIPRSRSQFKPYSG